MMLGEVAPGGAGSGPLRLVMMVLLAVFMGGLMVGRTPEYLKQRLHARHMKLVGLYILALPIAVLVGTAVAMAMPGERASMLNAGPHGLSEVLYAFTSSAANNGSAFAGFSGNTTWYNVRSRSRWSLADFCRSSRCSGSRAPSLPAAGRHHPPARCARRRRRLSR